MYKLPMCRICLIKDVRMHCLVNTQLQEIYELLSGNLLETKDTRPLHACYMCCARLRNCLQLRAACLHSEELFSQLLENDSCEVTPSQYINMQQTGPAINMIVDPEIHREIKMDPLLTTAELYEGHVKDLQDNVIGDEICSQLIKEEEIKYENVYSEDDNIEYSVQNIRGQVHSSSDNCYSREGTQENYISKSNHSNSSADWKDIVEKVESNSASDNTLDRGTPESCKYISSVGSKHILGDKTVKIVLQRVDLNSFEKSATDTKHLNPTDLEHTSQCNLNHSENVEMLKSSICEEYKQISHASSETHCRPNSDSFKRIRRRTREKSFQCPTCDKRFSHMSNLTIHIRTHTGEKPYKCDTCGKGFGVLYHLTRHIRIHTGEKPYKCDICGKSFSVMCHLSQHIRIHSDEKPYKCNTCGKCFRWKVSLSEHYITHTGKKPYKCDTCGKGFSVMCRLSRHIRIHTNEKPHKCDTCGKCFRYWSFLSKHILTHTGEKPYKCDTCGKCFRVKVSLSEHINTHTGVKPYNCDTCGKSFNRKLRLLCHIRTHSTV